MPTSFTNVSLGCSVHFEKKISMRIYNITINFTTSSQMQTTLVNVFKKLSIN